MNYKGLTDGQIQTLINFVRWVAEGVRYQGDPSDREVAANICKELNL
jgi:hypothetical protein